jgi:hypothetical protein
MREWRIGGMINGRGKSKYAEKILPRGDFVHHKSHNPQPLGLHPGLRGKASERFKLLHNDEFLLLDSWNVGGYDGLRVWLGRGGGGKQFIRYGCWLVTL